jgi:membrane protease YdiL (CAAX protease family)
MTRVIAAVLATALAAALVLVQPWLGRRRYRRLVATATGQPEARVRHYRRGIIGEWAAVALIAVVGLLARRSPASIGLRVGPNPASDLVIVAVVGALLGVTAALFRFGGRGIRDALRHQARGFQALLPRDRHERILFAGLALTAGICEELIFRGFGLAYVRWLWPGASNVELIVVTAVAFGVVHLYQGPRGVVLTGLVGAYLAWLVLSTGSLLPAMAIHALVDLRILALPDLSLPEPGDRQAATYSG